MSAHAPVPAGAPAPPAAKIHRVIARLNVGGPALHVVNLARGLEAHGFDTRLVAGSIGPEEGDMAWYAGKHGVEVTEIASLARRLDPLGDAATLWRLYRLFRRERPHVVHTHTAKAGTLGRLAAWAAGVPVIVHTYHGHVLGGGYFAPPVTRFFLGVERALARITDRLVVLTERQRREMADDLGVAERGRFVVVPLGLDLSPFADLPRREGRGEGRARMGVGEGVPVVGIVGRLVPIKDHELALATHAELVERTGEGPTPVLVVVGGGGEERERALRDEAARLGIGAHVRWLGWQRDLATLYAAMDALLLTSRDEGTPVAILEALAAGTPVVTVGVGGIPEVLAGIEGGYELVEERAPEPLAEALLRSLGRTGGEGGEGALARRRQVATRWSVPRLCADLAGLYRELLTEHRGVPG